VLEDMVLKSITILLHE